MNQSHHEISSSGLSSSLKPCVHFPEALQNYIEAFPDFALLERPHLPVCDHYCGNEKFFHKAVSLRQKIQGRFDITIDLEDGAPCQEIRQATETAVRLLSNVNHDTDRETHGGFGIRLHAWPSAACHEQLKILSEAISHDRLRLDFLMLPKVNGAVDVVECWATLREWLIRANPDEDNPRPLALHVLIETHGALAQVQAIAALPYVESLSFGLMDFVSAHRGAISDEALRSPGQFEHPLIIRAKTDIAAACHHYRKTPSHNVCTDFTNPAQCRADAEQAQQAFGFTRMWSIHPSQIEPIIDALTPSAALREKAIAILTAAKAANWGPIRHLDQLHDRASFRYYAEVLKRC